MGNQQTCCSRKLLQWCHSPCSVPFSRMLNEGCDSFCFREWYRQDIVSDDWLSFVVVSLEAVLTCIVKGGKCMRPCDVWITTLLFLINCNPIIGPLNFFITMKCSAKVLSPISKLSVAVDNAFSNWSLATCNWKLVGSSSMRILIEAFSFFVCPSHSGQLHWKMLLNPPRHLPLDYFQNPEAHWALIVFVSGILQRLVGDKPHLSAHLLPTIPQLVGLLWWEVEHCISNNCSRYMLFWNLDIGRNVLGADKERYWFVPCLISWRVFRGNYIVLWLCSLGWRRLVCYSRVWSFLNILYCRVTMSTI